MKAGVLITSAINAKFSVYSPEERLAQTLETIASVRAKMPKAIICLTDCGIPGVSDEIKSQLTADVDHFIDFSKDSNVNYVAGLTHQDTVKNLTELIVVSKFFKLAKEQGWFNGCDRVFKVSGRYVLNDHFNLKRYAKPDAKGKYVLSKTMLSQFPLEVTTHALQHMLRVYSFDAVLLDDFIGRLKQMIDFMQERIRASAYIDIEHLFHKFLPRDLVLEVARTGVEGHVAPNGLKISN
jgi:hypothetical protein